MVILSRWEVKIYLVFIWPEVERDRERERERGGGFKGFLKSKEGLDTTESLRELRSKVETEFIFLLFSRKMDCTALNC